MATIQKMWVIAFAIISLYYLFKENKHSIYFAILFACIATLTSINGLMIYAAGAVVLLLNKNLFQTKNLVWLASGILLAILYFHGYVFAHANQKAFHLIISHPVSFIAYNLTLLGSMLTVNLTYAIVGGAVIFIFLIYLFIKKYYLINPVIFSLILFILTTFLMTGLVRFQYGTEQALNSRYALWSTLIIACCYIAFISSFKSYKLVFVCFAFALFQNIRMQAKYLPIIRWSKNQFENNYRQITNGQLSSFDFGWIPFNTTYTRTSIDRPKHFLRLSDSLGVFHFKFKEDSVILNKIPSVNKDIIYSVDSTTQLHNNIITISGWAYINNPKNDSVHTFICLKNENSQPIKYLHCTKKKVKQSDNPPWERSGFHTYFDKKYIAPGKYKIYIILATDAFKAEKETNKVLYIGPVTTPE
jgi:hypothetical protein